MSKRCCRCKQVLPEDQFVKDKRRKDGLCPRCKNCYKDYYLKNSDSLLKSKSRYREAHRNELAQAAREYYQKHKERTAETVRAYVASHKDEHRKYQREYQLKYRRENHEQVRKLERANRAKNRDKRLAHEKARRAANKDLFVAYRQNYRAKKEGNGGKYSKEDIALLYRNQHGKCWWCGKPLGKKYHVDHRIPVSKGGSSDPSNLCLACSFCNLSKSDKMPWEWSDRLL